MFSYVIHQRRPPTVSRVGDYRRSNNQSNECPKRINGSFAGVNLIILPCYHVGIALHVTELLFDICSLFEETVLKNSSTYTYIAVNMKIFGRLVIEKYILVCLICCSTAFSSLVQAKKQNKRADETDTIIKKIMDGYEKGVHPNSNQKTGAVQVQIGVTPLALNIVST